jgi:hypothetical protein
MLLTIGSILVNTPKPGRLDSLLRIATQTPAALLSGTAGLLMPDAAGMLIGAVGGSVLAQVGADIAERVLSPRQEQRVGAVFLQAAGAITARQQLGEKIRADGFFDGDRSNGSEFTEGVFLTAKDSYEERKIPYLGNLIANVAFNEEISAATAHMALRVAEEMSWLEFCILGTFVDTESHKMPDSEAAVPVDWSSWAIVNSFASMTEGADSLLSNRRYTGSRGEPRFDLNLSGVEVASRGNLVGSLLQLGDIPNVDLREIYETLTGVHGSNDPLVGGS